MQLKSYTLTFHSVCYVAMYVWWYVKKVTQLKMRTASY